MSHLPDEFECACCGGVFPKAWSDEEAEKEAAEDPFDFQTPPENDPFNGEMATICHDCYRNMAAWATAHGGIENAIACSASNSPVCTHW